MNKSKVIANALFLCFLLSNTVFGQNSPNNDFDSLFTLENTRENLSSSLDAIDRLNDAANPYASQTTPVPIDLELLQYLQEQINSKDSLLEGGSPQDLDIQRFGSFALDSSSAPFVQDNPLEQTIAPEAELSTRLPQSESFSTLNDPQIGSNRPLNLTPTTGLAPIPEVIIPAPGVMSLLITHALLSKRRRS